MCISSGRTLIVIVLLAGIHSASTAAGADRSVSQANLALAQADSADAVTLVNPGEVVLYWTAPGDDGYMGQAARYEMRYQPFFYGPIDSEDEWNRATPASDLPVPSPAGYSDSTIVSGLSYGGAYYFCLKTFDEMDNASGLSNSPLRIAGDTTYIPGDANASGVVNGLDITYLVNYFKGGPGIPAPFLRADANGSCTVNGLDVVYLKCYFCGGPPPIRGDCAGLGLAAKHDGVGNQVH